tara:strand:- start:356 stop:1915 length:1560 start_codon:yes stop_codon:yes gene_type:complete
MARIRQQYPQNYGSSGNINTEFENLVRYINSAELGNNTVGELLSKLFDANGVFDGPIELRKDSSAGIQYRVGEYADTITGWISLATLAELRGEAGKDFGTIGAPILHTRVDFTSTSSQTVYDYAHDATDELLVYKAGVLQREGASFDYQKSATAGTASAGAVTFNAGNSTGTVIGIFKIRASAITGYTRTDTVTTGNQAVFAFVHTEETKLQVYKNGILQRDGGSFDYTSSFTGNTITFNSAVSSGNTITILTVENTSIQAVTGMMFEEKFVDSGSGLIKFDKISIADNAITQAKVANLVSNLSAKAKLTVSSSTPSGSTSGDLWHDTSVTPNQLKFYDGSQWLRTSPDSSLPTFTTSNSGNFVKVNGTGTALEYGTIDLSSVVAITQKGAANGVASLDSSGRLPSSQLPVVLSSDSLYTSVATPGNQGYKVKRIYRQKIRIDGISVQTASGTCSVQVSFDGTGFGSTVSASSVKNDGVLGTPLEIDATTVSHEIGFIVTSNSSASALEVTLAVSIIAS